MLVLSLLIGLLTLLLPVQGSDNGLTDKVSWDKYSLMIEGKRVYIFAGEFHYQRLPVPELWPDVFQKYKAHGLNAVSIYFFWSYHSPNNATYDLKTGARNIQRLMDMAKEAGLYVIARPGPYINAETSAGGLALWTTDGSAGEYRTADPKYRAAWRGWVREISGVLRKNQISEGGPVILLQVENELQQTSYDPEHTTTRHMVELKKAFREEGIVVPFTHNELNMRAVSWSKDWKNPTGAAAVDVYGLDSYPDHESCTKPDQGFNLVRNYYDWFKNYSFTQPSYQPEFQAGWFQPWGGPFYDDCKAEHDPAFADVFYKNNLAQKVTLMSLYMAYGGTNWGHSAAPVVYTSYDYGAPLRETRQVQDKFKQTKLIGLFTRVSQDLLKTDMEAHGAGVSVSNKAVYTWVLRNPDTKAGFYFLQQNESRSRANQSTSVTLQTSAGTVQVPEVVLEGRQSKILVTDYRLGSMNMLYSTAEVLTYGLYPNAVLFLYLKEGQKGEFAMKFDTANVPFEIYGQKADFAAGTPYIGSDGSKYARYVWTQPKGMIIAQFTNGFLVYIMDMPSAYKFYAPTLTSNPDVKPNQHVIIMGPSLVRSAKLVNKEIHVTGDHEVAGNIGIYLGEGKADRIFWNGKPLPTQKMAWGSIVAKMDAPVVTNVSLPELTGWKIADSLPERHRDFNDSKWTVCDKWSTQSPVKPLNLPVLYSSDYGFHAGIKLYRASFDSTAAASVRLTVQGGNAAGWSAWLNSVYIGGSPGDAKSSSTKATLSLKGVPLEDAGNVLVVVTDYNGHDEEGVKPAGPANPRGLLGAELLTSDVKQLGFMEWKIQGNAGGEKEIDSVRGSMNEGGLYGERLGWHLPGFDTSSWKSGSPIQGLSEPGIAWYTTTFELNIPANMDVPIGVEFSAPKGTVARVQLFINGYQYGKYLPAIGPQTKFPLQPGILNTRGKNTISLSLWSQDKAGAKLSEVKLIKYGMVETGFNLSHDWSYLQPGWTQKRLEY